MGAGQGGNHGQHGYGDRVRVLGGAYLHSWLARVGAAETPRAIVLEGVRRVYEALLAAAADELPRVSVDVPTRMAPEHGAAAHVREPILDPATQVVVCDVIRGGIVPAQLCFERLSALLEEPRVRLDHLNMARVSDERGRVVGVDLSGSKVGGSVDDAFLFLPDPMGATGSTIQRALEHYREHHGRPRRTVVLTMISTPEFLARVLEFEPELCVVTARVDRGLSAPEVLREPLGAMWDRERGLDDRGYIVPGAGGLGEVLNNAWC